MKPYVVLFAISFAQPALAAEICVTCSDPAGTYLCSLEKEKQLRLLYKKDDLYEKVCTALLPKLGPHKKCVATSEKPCSGTPKTITLSDAIAVIMAK